MGELSLLFVCLFVCVKGREVKIRRSRLVFGCCTLGFLEFGMGMRGVRGVIIKWVDGWGMGGFNY